MHCSITCLYERGRLIDDRRVANQRAVVGDLRVEWVHDPRRLRVVRYASLREIGPGGMKAKLLPNLLEPELMGMIDSVFTLSGFELVTGVEYRQSWLARTVAL